MTKEYRTHSLNKAAFLLTRDNALKTHERNNSKITFIFEETDKVKKDSDDFYNNCDIKVQSYIDSLRRLKTIIYD